MYWTSEANAKVSQQILHIHESCRIQLTNKALGRRIGADARQNEA